MGDQNEYSNLNSVLLEDGAGEPKPFGGAGENKEGKCRGEALGQSFPRCGPLILVLMDSGRAAVRLMMTMRTVLDPAKGWITSV